MLRSDRRTPRHDESRAEAQDAMKLGGIVPEAPMLKRLLKVATRERTRCSAMLLLVCLLLPFAQLAVASTQDSEASLPACCRSHGKHKCFVRASEVRSGQQTASGFRTASTLSEKCPSLPASSGFSFHSASGLPRFRSLRLLLAETTVSLFDRTDAFHSNSQRANQKRGPPSIVANS
jgi:hypothetical protein